MSNGGGGGGSAVAGLLDWVIQNSNSLAAKKQAGPALKNLKNAIQGLPFGLEIPGMSKLLQGNFLQGLMGIVGMLSGNQGGGSQSSAPVATIHPELQPIIKQILNKTVTLDQVQNIIGGSGVFASALANPALVVAGALNNPATDPNLTRKDFVNQFFFGTCYDEQIADIDALIANVTANSSSNASANT